MFRIRDEYPYPNGTLVLISLRNVDKIYETCSNLPQSIKRKKNQSTRLENDPNRRLQGITETFQTSDLERGI